MSRRRIGFQWSGAGERVPVLACTRILALFALTISVAIASTLGAGSNVAQANHATADSEMTIFHSGVCTAGSTPVCTGQNAGDAPGAGGTGLTLAVGAQFHVQANVTDLPNAGAPSDGAPWMFAWTDAVVDFVSVVNLDTDFSSCTLGTTSLASGIQRRAGGCAAGTPGLTPIVDITLQCAAEGTTSIALYGRDSSAAFGSNVGTLTSPASEMENRMTPVGGFWPASPSQLAAFTLVCGAGGATPTPTATNTPLPVQSTNTPGPTNTPCVTNCPTTPPSVFTRTPTPEPTGTRGPGTAVPTSSTGGGQTPTGPQPTSPTGRPGGTGTIGLPDTGARDDSQSGQLMIILMLVTATAMVIAGGSSYWLRRRASRRG